FAFRLPDLNNNPYREPYRRVAAGTWDMMDRGCFNGPGGPHTRWVVPPVGGAAMPAGLMVKNRLENEFITEEDVLTLSREGLAQTGLAVARVTARAVEPLPGSFAGIIVRLDGAEPHDRTPEGDPFTEPLTPGIPNYNAYSLEVVQRIGYDSFTPDNGVLLAKFKDSLRGSNGPREANSFNCFIWVIDAHPEDMNMVDYVRPDGEEVMRTIADYRQLNDALFHAGPDSGSEFEWEDPHNRLHFYVIDLQRNPDGILSYTLGVRSLDGSGPQERGVDLAGPSEQAVGRLNTPVVFTLSNTGVPGAPDPTLHPDDAAAFTNTDVYRLSASVEGEGWSVRILNALSALEPGASQAVTVYVTRQEEAAESATLTLRATSESDPSTTAVATVALGG
ncbi:MAG TPA: hypothetical protein VLA43_07245, partial [Longimicrobiales bacterium]|nr:hypothetical protein [Longimicrobiales bacterium]